MKRQFRIVILVAASILVGSVPLSAQNTIRVPSDFSTIQAGLNAAGSGDTVLVGAGTYTGANNRNLNFYGKTITLRSEDGPGGTIIDAQHLDRCFVFVSGEGLDTVVDGFTIKNGQPPTAAADGGGIFSIGATPTIRNCVITSCSSDRYGGGMAAGNAVPFIDSCTFSFNSSARDGGGLYGWAKVWNTDFIGNEALGTGGVPADGGGAALLAGSEVKGCRFVANNATRGGALYLGGDKVVHNSLFIANEANIAGATLNHGGAIYADSGRIGIAFCTFSGNNAFDLGSTVYSATAQVLLYHSIAWDSSTNGVIASSTGTVAALYSDILQSSGVFPGDHNINADPLFTTGPGSSNFNGYYLSQTAAGQAVNSPCLDAGFVDSTSLALCNFGHGADVCLDQMTTRTDIGRDTSLVDFGYHAFFGLVFADGFESGTTGRWNQTLP